MDIVCFTHLRWDFVFQRPQHLLSRFARNQRVFVVEEPEITCLNSYFEILPDAAYPNLHVVKLFLSNTATPEEAAVVLKTLVNAFMLSANILNFIVWYYTPMALQYSEQLEPSLTVYDCMDELSAFNFAPPELSKLENVLFQKADIAFTGGFSLYEAKKHLHNNIHPFPSSIDRSHFATARLQQSDPQDQRSIPFPRLGFFGVIDERLDINLIKDLASLRPKWQFIFIGPVVKIDPSMLPAAPNISYLGSKTYNELPFYLSGWDIALIPFALNDSTRFISPTKTPEYLAGGKRVISTPIRDVIVPYQKLGLVQIAATASDFVAAAENMFRDKKYDRWLAKTDQFLAKLSWDKTWQQMKRLIEFELNRPVNKRPQKNITHV